MTREAGDIDGMNPHVVKKGAEETDGDFVRFESTMYPSSVDAPAARSLSHEPWGLDNDFEHVHPTQEEHWTVVAGTLRVEVDGDERTVSEGEEVTLPSDVPHRHYNPTDRPIRVVWERRPAFRTEAWAESVYALAQRGETDTNGVPNPLQIPVWIDEFPEETAYPTVAPVAVQRAASALIAPVSRMAGFKARYVRETADGSP